MKLNLHTCALLAFQCHQIILLVLLPFFVIAKLFPCFLDIHTCTCNELAMSLWHAVRLFTLYQTLTCWRPGKIAYWTSLKVYTLRIKVVRWRSLLTWFGLNVYDPTANKMLLVIQCNLNVRAKHIYICTHDRILGFPNLISTDRSLVQQRDPGRSAVVTKLFRFFSMLFHYGTALTKTAAAVTPENCCENRYPHYKTVDKSAAVVKRDLYCVRTNSANFSF